MNITLQPNGYYFAQCDSHRYAVTYTDRDRKWVMRLIEWHMRNEHKSYVG